MGFIVARSICFVGSIEANGTAARMLEGTSTCVLRWQHNGMHTYNFM